MIVRRITRLVLKLAILRSSDKTLRFDLLFEYLNIQSENMHTPFPASLFFEKQDQNA